MDRRQFTRTLSMAGAGLVSGGLAYSQDNLMGDSGLFDVQARIASLGRVNVSYEWAPLQEVVVGYPFLKLSNDFPLAVKKWLDVPAEFQELMKIWLRCYRGKTLEEIANDPDVNEPGFRQLYEAQVEQVDAVIQLLRSRGIVVHQIPPLNPAEQAYLANLDGNAVQLFPRDPILVVGEHYFELPLLLPYRRREHFAIRHVTETLLRSQNIPIRSAPEPYPLPGNEKGFGPSAFLEGGDVLVFGKRLLVGISGNASNLAGVTWLKQQLGPSYSIEIVQLRPQFLHLDVALCTPRPGLALICRSAFPNRTIPNFLKGWTLIEVAEKDARESLACNGLILDEQTIIVADKPTYVGDQLEKARQIVYRMPFNTVSALGGAFRCWHHPIRRCE
jgi:N-dimethylarginine dimethylaminohydrolase